MPPMEDSAMLRRLTDLLRSMTSVLPIVGFGSKSSPTVPREHESITETLPPGTRELHDQVHEPDAPRLERGHPKR